MYFQRITRLWRTVSALWAAWRFVCEGTQSLEFVTRHLIGNRLQRASVKRAGNAVAPISAAVEKRLKMHSCYRAVFLYASLDMHQHWMTAAMAIESFLACERSLHRPSGNHRELANYHLVIERIALATKTTPVRSGNNANMTCRQLQNLRQRPVNVMRCLSRAPEGQLFIGIEIADGCVLLHGQVRVAFIEESILANQVCLGKTFFDVAEFQRDFLVHVARIAVVVNPGFIDKHGFFNCRDRVERFIFNLDQIHRIESDIFIDGRHSRDRVANETNLLNTECMFILTDRQNAVRNWQIPSSDNCDYPGQCRRSGCVDAFD